MIQWLGALILVVGFIFLFQILGLVKKSQDVGRIANTSLNIIRSTKLSDEQKESQLQQNSQKLFGLFFILAGGGAIAVGLPIGVLWLGDRLGWLSLSATLNTAVSPAFLIASSILAVVLLCIKPGNFGKPVSNTATQTNTYSQLDQTLHHVAFKTYTAQVAIADVEDEIFSKQLRTCKTERPVFITALPRAGTTLLLECCANSPEFAAHCYRDMPFVLIPCLWNRFSQAFQQSVDSTERAHGDGMKISPDSPEALEEVVWKTFWKRHYQADRIIPWDNEANEEFNEFFRSHLRKIILLRRENSELSPRYISKNNANIARTRILKQLFPDSVIIIPFRHPLQHANSLLQQHLNFLQIHNTDSFASEYMKAIGHYDFGQNLCPIDFAGWFDQRESKDATSLAFWLEYWIASYQHLLAENTSEITESPVADVKSATRLTNSLNFFDYEALCENPESGLLNLAEITKSRHPDALLASASRIHHPRPKEIDTNALPSSLLRDAHLIYDRLKEMTS